MYTYITLHCINLHYIYTYIYGIIEYVYTLFSSTVFSHLWHKQYNPRTYQPLTEYPINSVHQLAHLTPS